MVNIKRWLTHLFMPPWRLRLAFSSATLKAIETAVSESERLHRGELRFAVENTLPLWQVWQGISARQRAVEVFAKLGVWDTEENSGVLIYVLLADREVHIVADRGINQCVTQLEWNQIAELMQSTFSSGAFEQGAVEGIQQITHLLAEHFPALEDNANELSDTPVII